MFNNNNETLCKIKLKSRETIKTSFKAINKRQVTINLLQNLKPLPIIISLNNLPLDRNKTGAMSKIQIQFTEITLLFSSQKNTRYRLCNPRRCLIQPRSSLLLPQLLLTSLIQTQTFISNRRLSSSMQCLNLSRFSQLSHKRNHQHQECRRWLKFHKQEKLLLQKLSQSS